MNGKIYENLKQNSGEEKCEYIDAGMEKWVEESKKTKMLQLRW